MLIGSTWVKTSTPLSWPLQTIKIEIMTKPITLVFLYLLIFISCSKNDTCQLSGKLENIEDSTFLYLTDIDSYNIVDSILALNNKFSLQLSLTQAKLFLLHKKDDKNKFRDRKFIWLEPSKISIEGDYDFMKNIKISGSKSHSEYLSYNLMVDSSLRRISKMKDSLIYYCLSKETRFIEKRLEIIPDSVLNDSKYQLLKNKYDSLGINLGTKMISFLSSNPSSFVTLSTLYSESYLWYLETKIRKRYLNKDQIKSLYEKLTDELKKSEKGLMVKKYFELPKVPEVGDQAPDIAQTSPQGDTIRLSEYKGQYVLLDFWSSWCGPCRADFKGMKEVYKKYHKMGFEIFGVSCDKKKSDWLKAIEHDSLPWIAVSDLKGFQNEAFLAYDIKGVPTYILIDREGTIIEKNFNGSEYYDAALKEIFEKENSL